METRNILVETSLRRIHLKKISIHKIDLIWYYLIPLASRMASQNVLKSDLKSPGLIPFIKFNIKFSRV